MNWVSRAVLAAALLNCAASAARAETDTQWLTDPKTQCAVFDAKAGTGDAVSWSGICVDGLASGPGTATFTQGGAVVESFTATFAKGVAQDGHVEARWGAGWRYDGDSVGGKFHGQGVLVNDAQDRFEGHWVDGKLNGQGVLTRANGERYAGAWKDDLPNGKGVLRRTDGAEIEGEFIDGKLAPATEAQADAPVQDAKPEIADNKPARSGASAFADLSGKTLVGIDGSSIALTLVEGGIERKITAAGAAPKKTIFTFMNDRLGTVAEDGAAIANVTGFFRLTDNGVEVRYADDRTEMLSANNDGGVQMTVTAADTVECRSWYPEGHAFSEEEKKAALAAYASKLGLASVVAPPACPATGLRAGKPLPERRADAKTLRTPAAFSPVRKVARLETVSVKNSVVHPIDAPLVTDPVIAGPVVATGGAPQGGSRCLAVESDGHYWGFRNQCGFSVQFAYCLAGGPEKLTACAAEGGGVNAVSGSVAAHGFGALSADKSLSEKDAHHDFRWIACDGGAGEVVARLDRADPPGGRCERAAAITASAH